MATSYITVTQYLNQKIDIHTIHRVSEAYSSFRCTHLYVHSVFCLTSQWFRVRFNKHWLKVHMRHCHITHISLFSWSSHQPLQEMNALFFLSMMNSSKLLRSSVTFPRPPRKWPDSRVQCSQCLLPGPSASAAPRPLLSCTLFNSLPEADLGFVGPPSF